MLVLVTLTAIACGGDGQARGGRPSVVASFYPIFEAAERVGGERAEVQNLTAPGAEPHDLELTPDQVDLLLDADLVLYLGEGFQPAVEEVVDGREGLTVDLLRQTDEEDPHVWLDPVLMADLVGLVARGFSEADPDGREAYQDNARAYREEIDALHGEFLAALANCDRRLIVTSHDAFGRMAEQYDLDVEAITGISPEAEPDPARLAELTDLVEREGVTTIFTETLVSPEVAETLAREAGVRTAVLNPIEGLTPEQAEAGDTYLSLMRDNLESLREALGCE
jgi:zinc transport system substrate-binding protein